ncbi:hypothetical protein FRB94_004946 [Tulasnella sp. JGI-2019a]|nr:hypothetical protein FRB94_004946 [Tulasnella sp. JGI-2019a]
MIDGRCDDVFGIRRSLSLHRNSRVGPVQPSWIDVSFCSILALELMTFPTVGHVLGILENQYLELIYNRTHYRLVYDEIATTLQKVPNLNAGYRIAAGVMRALKAFQELGYVHRDLSVSNLYMAEDGKGKINDLEYARRLTHPSGLEPESVSPKPNSGPWKLTYGYTVFSHLSITKLGPSRSNTISSTMQNLCGGVSSGPSRTVLGAVVYSGSWNVTDDTGSCSCLGQGAR